MAYKYTIQSNDACLDKAQSSVGKVAIDVWNDADVGVLALHRPDTLNYKIDPGDWPVTKASLDTKAVAAIVAKYPGATPG